MHVPYPNIGDMEYLKAKINKKAYDLFKANKERPQLQVVWLFKTNTANAGSPLHTLKYQDVENASWIKALNHVRAHHPLLLFILFFKACLYTSHCRFPCRHSNLTEVT